MTSCCPIVELRQYTLHAHRRDVLIDLFEREFIESQEALGISVIGQFHDRDDPNRFVWLRGFPGMAARGEALAAFYGGTIWQAHREAANATMLAPMTRWCRTLRFIFVTFPPRASATLGARLGPRSSRSARATGK